MVSRIERLCKEHNTNLKQLEIKIDLANGTIRKWEKNAPKAESLKKVADFFNVSIDYLLGRTDTESVNYGDKLPADIKEIVALYRKLDLNDQEMVLQIAKRMSEMNKK